MKIDFYKHNISSQDIKLVNNVLKSRFLSTGKVTTLFEKNFAKFFSVKYCLGTSNCSTALLISLKALNIGEGDEVITSPLSYPATANAIELAGARAVFVDVDKESGLMDENLIKNKINKKTKAIIPIHLYGQMCNMKKINLIAKKYNLFIIEDAAQAIEAKRDNYKPGKFSDITVFSFYTLKNITSGEGGAIITNKKYLYNKLSKLRYHGLEKTPFQRINNKKYIPYDMNILGYKCNMSDIQASLLINQLKRINHLWRRRSKVKKSYDNFLKNLREVELIKNIPDSNNACHLYTILVNKNIRNKFIKYLKEKGIEVTINYYPVHLLSYYKKKYNYKRRDFPSTEFISDSTITLPLYPKLKNTELEYIKKNINTYFK